MPNYEKMYALVCGAASEALDLLPETEENRPGRERLQAALLEAEELYISAEDLEEYSGKLVLRIPRSLHKSLKEAAAAEGVSLNQYMLYKLAR